MEDDHFFKIEDDKFVWLLEDNYFAHWKWLCFSPKFSFNDQNTTYQS
jgi:hypothetical protein